MMLDAAEQLPCPSSCSCLLCTHRQRPTAAAAHLLTCKASPQATKERRSTIVDQTDPPFPRIVNHLNFLDTNKIKLTEELLQFRIEIAEKCAEEPFACVRSGRNSAQMRRYHFLDSTSLV
jgi:hypothetical protein